MLKNVKIAVAEGELFGFPNGTIEIVLKMQYN